MMLELNEAYLPTGKFYYRDFDITSFYRARFPFLHTKEWLEYCKMGENRTTLSSNMAMREYIGMSFLFHFIDNLIYPCVKYGVYEKIIVGKPVYSGIDYYKSDCGLIVATDKENVFEIFNMKNGTKNG